LRSLRASVQSLSKSLVWQLKLEAVMRARFCRGFVASLHFWRHNSYLLAMTAFSCCFSSDETAGVATKVRRDWMISQARSKSL
jgi:hypothetical protein